MADSPSAATESNSQSQEPENRVSDMNQTDSVPSQLQSSGSASIPVAANPNLNPPQISPLQPPLSFAPPPAAPSFRPLPLYTPQFPHPGFPNVNYVNPGIQPPGFSSGAPGLISGSVSAPQQMMPYQVFPGQASNPAMRPYAPIPNGYATIPAAVPQGTIPPAGVPRFTSPYASVVRGPFPPRPPGAIGIIPTLSRPLLPGVPGIRPMMPLVMRPVIPPSVTPAELPQTTIYIGRIAQTVENDFMLSLLQLCGPVKSWKRVQDPTNGTPRAFGFCEFESAEGVLRAIRLLTNFNVDGQELKLKGTQATRKYLRQYVEKKIENSKKLKETQDGEAKEEDGSAVVAEKSDTVKSVEDSKEDNDPGEKEDREIAISAIVSNEDKEADREALQKLTSSIEARLKTRPLPQPPAQAVDDPSGNADPSAKMRDGDSDGDVTRSDAVDDKNDAEDIKQTSDHDRPETSSPERNRRYDRRSRDRDRERDVKREKEREIERYERETERERIRKEREQRRKVEEAERQYEECLKEWEYREREKEKQRQYERDKEKERERKRKKEIIYDEDDEDDDSRKKWRRSVLEEKRKKKLREKEDDLADRQKEEEEIAEAMRRADEEQKQKQQREALKLLSVEVEHDDVKTVLAEESSVEIKDKVVDQHFEGDIVCENHIGFESTLVSGTASDQQHSGNVPTRRLGFGLVGSGKRTAVPSVFHEEDDDEAHKEKKMRPLVPIDYSAEELEAVQPPTSGVQPPNLAAAAEFAKRISNANTKEEKSNEKERGRRSSDKPSYRDKERNDEEFHRKKDENRSFDRERDRDRVFDKLKTPDNKKLLDAKQLIDMIPKTKEELFSYEINWAIYDKHELQERMRPWISKKITEFLGEEEATLVDYIVSSTQEHVKASQMLELLQSILDEEAEMFVLKMWRMLIFEIKKVETGIASRSKA